MTRASRSLAVVAWMNWVTSVDLTGGVHRHGLVQVAHLAVALRVGQQGDVRGHIRPVGGHAVGGIGPEPHVGGRARLSVRGGVAAKLLVGVAVGVNGGAGGVADIDALCPGGFQHQELARIGATVAIGVFPDFKGGEGGVVLIQLAVAVGVQLRQRLEAIPRLAPVGEQGLRAEEFAAGVDQSVAIEIAHQQAVVGGNPAGLFGEAVGRVVEVGAGADRRRLHTIAIQVEHDGRGDGGGSFGFIFNAIDDVRSSVPVVIYK